MQEKDSHKVASIWAEAYAGRKSPQVRECGSVVWLQHDNFGNYRLVANGCKNRWCPRCHSSAFARQRRRIKRMIAKTATHTLRFITLTLRHTDAPLAEQLTHLTGSFRRLRQTRIWKSKVDYGAAVIELAYNKSRRQWHPHLHIIASGRFLPQKALSRCWCKATDGSSIVDIRRVKNPSEASKYLAKYMCKNPPVERWPEPIERAREIVQATHGRRLVLNFGRWPDVTGDDLPAETWHNIAPLSWVAARARDGEPWAIDHILGLRRSLPEHIFDQAIRAALIRAGPG